MEAKKRELDISKVKVEKLTETEGNFTNEEGNTFKYKNYVLEFTINDYPLIFKAKVDKILKDYIITAEEYNA